MRHTALMSRSNELRRPENRNKHTIRYDRECNVIFVVIVRLFSFYKWNQKNVLIKPNYSRQPRKKILHHRQQHHQPAVFHTPKWIQSHSCSLNVISQFHALVLFAIRHNSRTP